MDDNLLEEERVSDTETSVSGRCSKFKQKYVTLGVLFMINLLNYMDRFTIAGIPAQIKKFYNINDKDYGSLQTTFIIAYMLFSPVFGYLGDRWIRKYIIMIGLVIWSVTTLISSFVSNFYAFLFMRALVGIGEASYNTIAPTIISDYFTGDSRIKALGLFFFAVPVGSGLGYVLGFGAHELFHHWQWALRITPMLGMACLLVILFFHRDPARGLADKGTHLRATSLRLDLVYLSRNKSFCLVTAMFTSVCFVLGALTWWAVPLMSYAVNAHYHDASAADKMKVPIIFGVSVCMAGLVGVVLGEELTRRLRRFTALSDVYVCMGSLLIVAPVLFFALISSYASFWLAVFLVFLVNLFICFQWAVVSDMTLAVVVPTRRSIANAVQMLCSHLLGDAISPFIIGFISDQIRTNDSFEAQYISLQYSLFLIPFISLMASCFAIALAFTILHDKEQTKLIIEETRAADDVSNYMLRDQQ